MSKASMNKTRIMTISSQVAEGAVGNRVSVLSLQRLGHNVTAVPSVFLTWHPGHNALYGQAQRATPSADEFAAILKNIKNAPWFGDVGGILTGYLGNAAQVAPICDLIDALKAKNPDALYICDPVIGEQHGLYVNTDIATAIRDDLVPRADWITPNRFELAWLSGKEINDNDDIVAAARGLACKNALVTSAFSDKSSQIANLAIAQNAVYQTSHKKFNHPPHGTGDMMAAAFAGALLNNKPIDQALREASKTVLAAIADAAKTDARDLRLSAPEPRIGTLRIESNQYQTGYVIRR